MRVVMDELAEDVLAVLLILAGIENVFVPHIVDVLSPRHDRLIGIAGNQVQESPVFGFDLVGVVEPTLVPRLSAEILLLNLG